MANYFQGLEGPASALESLVRNELKYVYENTEATAGNIRATLNNPNFFRGLALSVGTGALFTGPTRTNIENFEIGGSQEFVFSQLAAGSKTVISNCQFEYKNPLDLDDLKSFNVPICSIDVKMKNKFVKTLPLGANSEVMEYLGSPSMDITIEGLLVNTMIHEDGETPWLSRPSVLLLNEMCDQIMEFDLTNGYWGENQKTAIDLNGLVVENFELPEPKELKNVQPFIIKAKRSFVTNTNTLFESLI